MVLISVKPLKEEDMYEFLGLLPKESIKTIHLDLSNGTETRIKELPSGGYLEMRELELQSNSVDSMKKDLEHVYYNQIIKCSVYLSNGKESTTLDLSLLELELHLYEKPNLYSLEKVLQFARKKKIHKVSMRF